MESFRSRLRRSLAAARAPKGFTLIEMLVCLAIIGIISAVVISSQGTFNKTILLADSTYDLGLTLQNAEVYGLASQAVVGVSTNTGYGIHFALNTPSSFIFFADTYPVAGAAGTCHPIPPEGPSSPNAYPGNCAYDPGEDQIVNTYTIGNSVFVSNFCAYAAGSWSCATSNGSTLTSLDVVFSRSEPEPYISVNGSYNAAAPVSEACIAVSSADGNTRYVSVLLSGAISANAASCPL